MRLIGAGQKFTLSVQIPHPTQAKSNYYSRDGLSDQIPDSPGKVNIQMPGVCPGGGGGC